MTGFLRGSGVTASLFVAMAAFTVAVAALMGAGEPPAENEEPPNRYQAIAVGEDTVFVIDSATGRCWSKRLTEPRWRDEGNPAEESETPRRAAGRKPMLSLPNGEPPEVTVHQRGRAVIPGSDGTLFVHLNDITEGQVLVSIRDSRGETLAGEKSLAKGQSLTFDVDSHTYAVTVRSMTNLLTGDDFAVVTVGNPSGAPTAAEPQPANTLPDRGGDADPAPPGTASARGSQAEEDRKIEALIAHVEGMQDASFVRNGSEYDGQAAATFLRAKWDANRSDIRTARDFIDKLARASSTSGQPYLIRFSDGKEIKSSDHLHAELERIEKMPP